MPPQLIHLISQSLCVALVASGILFAPKAIACEPPPSAQAAANSSLREIHLGMSGAEVLQQLGTPQNFEHQALRCGFDYVYLYYPQRFVLLQVPGGIWNSDAMDAVAQGFVIGFSTTHSDFSTPEGIAIGASRSEVIDTYGRPQATRSIEDGQILTFRQSDYNLTLQFRNGRVTEIGYSVVAF